jgi:hypothetical protein
MPDPYATIADADTALQECLSDVLELRGGRYRKPAGDWLAAHTYLDERRVRNDGRFDSLFVRRPFVR